MQSGGQSLCKVLSAQKLQFFRIVPAACFELLSPLRPISFQSGCVWWCPDALVEEFVRDFSRMRVVWVWVERVNEISRTKVAQGFECTKAAVLSHRSGCLLRTVVPIETDFFSERLCVVTSRLPWRRLCPWLQRSTSRSTFHWICDIQPMYYCWVFIECLGYWFHGRAANKRRFSTSRKNIHWFLGVLCRMPSKDENKKILEYQRWLRVHKPIPPMYLCRFPSTSFKSRWPRFLGNVWIKMISFDVLIAPACPRHCNGGYAVWRVHIIAWLSKCVRGLHFPMLGLETEMGKTAGTYCTKT